MHRRPPASHIFRRSGVVRLKVRIPTMLESYTGGKSEVEATGRDICEVLADLDGQFPGIRFRLVNEQDKLRPHMRIFVNKAAVRSLDVKLVASDEVIILQSLSGG